MDSLIPSAAARSPLFVSPSTEQNYSDMIFTRTGSASALSRSATSNAASSLIGPAATGAQHTGADMSITGSDLGMAPMLP